MKYFAVVEEGGNQIISVQEQPDTDPIHANFIEIQPEQLPLPPSYAEAGIIYLQGDYTLEALPLPCTVTIEGIDYPVTEQPTFEFNAEGVYTITVDAGYKYPVKEFEIDYQP